MRSPTTLPVLQELAAAGDAGLLAGELSRRFDYPANATKLQARVNSVLLVQQRQGHVKRGGLEPSPYYHRVPVYRWYITPAGLDYLASGGYPRRVRENARQRAVQAAERQARRDRYARLVAEATARAAEAGDCRRRRDEIIKWARGEGMALEAIGALFGITRERARQVYTEPKPRRTVACQCIRCRADRVAEWKAAATAVDARERSTES